MLFKVPSGVMAVLRSDSLRLRDLMGIFASAGWSDKNKYKNTVIKHFCQLQLTFGGGGKQEVECHRVTYKHGVFQNYAELAVSSSCLQCSNECAGNFK